MKKEKKEADLAVRIREIEENGFLSPQRKREEIDREHHEAAVARANEAAKYEMEKQQEVTNREREMEDIANKTLGLQVGGGMGGYMEKLTTMKRAVEDARIDGNEKKAAALEDDNQAALERMGKDVDRQLRHSNPMSFESGGDFYKSFSTRINNADPEKHEQLAVLRTIRDLLSHNRVASLEKQHEAVH
jgi:predicted phosphoribosyltransferase